MRAEVRKPILEKIDLRGVRFGNLVSRSLLMLLFALTTALTGCGGSENGDDDAGVERSCESDSDCNDGNVCTQDICVESLCQTSSEPAGTACGDPSSNACDNPDQCDGNGVCQPNYVARRHGLRRHDRHGVQSTGHLRWRWELYDESCP